MEAANAGPPRKRMMLGRSFEGRKTGSPGKYHNCSCVSVAPVSPETVSFGKNRLQYSLLYRFAAC